MVRLRVIGRDCLELFNKSRQTSSLDEITSPIDWRPIVNILSVYIHRQKTKLRGYLS